MFALAWLGHKWRDEWRGERIARRKRVLGKCLIAEGARGAEYNPDSMAAPTLIPFAPAPHPANLGTGEFEPRLAVAWERAGGKVFENLTAVLAPKAKLRKFRGRAPFYECWVRAGRLPARSVAASVGWHALVFFLLAQFGRYLVSADHASAFNGLELTWSGPIEEFPLFAPRAEKKAPAPRREAAKAEEMPAPEELPKPDAFHPTQTIVSAPKSPTHPRQTLIQPSTPNEAPRILPNLPNIAILADDPARPRLKITAEAFARIRPKELAARSEASPAIPEVPNSEVKSADINIASTDAPAPPKTALPMAPGAALVAAPKDKQGTAGEVAAPNISSGNADRTIIAISANPAPPAPEIAVPAGNLMAKVTIAPDAGKTSADAGAAAKGAGASAAGNSSAANSAPGISVTGGAPKSSSVISGGGGADRRGMPSNLHVAPGMTAKPDAPRADAAKPSLAERIKEGTPPEKLLGGRVYTVHLNAPNLASASGSWILNFAELDDPDANVLHHPTGELAAPMALREVDPRFPPALVQAKVQGEVILYAIIRENGTVDSIELVHGVEPTLDQNAMDAFAKWKFEPAKRNGVAVALEAVVRIPFKSVAPQY